MSNNKRKLPMTDNKSIPAKFEVEFTETLVYTKVVKACTIGEAIDIALNTVEYCESVNSYFGDSFSVKRVK